MTSNFVIWARAKSNGTHPLVIRLSNGRKMRVNINTPLCIQKEHFNKKLFKCKNTHPAYISINKSIEKYKTRIDEAINRFISGNFSFNQVVGYIKGELQMGSLDEFVDTYFRRFKSDQAYNDYKDLIGIVKGHMDIKGDLKWDMINRDFYDVWLQNMENRNLSRRSIKSYAIKLQAILNDAVDREIIHSYARMPKVLKTGGRGRRKNPREQEISTFTSKELKTLINGAKNLAQWQTYALLTLQFGLRGFYPADIVKMREKDIDDPSMLKILQNEVYIYHLRSKTQHTKNMHMYIHIGRSNAKLIMMLKRSTLKLWGKKYGDKLAHPNHFYSIWDYDPTENAKWHSNRWACHSRRLRKHGLNMMSARKSFQTFCEELEISDKDTPVQFNERTRLILLGRMGDPILERSYSNKRNVNMRKAINTAHKYVLDKFDYKEIVNLLEKKLEDFKTLPLWVRYNPLFCWDNMYRKMHTKAEGIKLVENNMYRIYGKGKIVEKGYYMGIPAQWVDKKSKAQFKAEKIDKGYEWYWRMFEDEKMNNVTTKDYEESLRWIAKKEKERLESEGKPTPFNKYKIDERKREKSVVIKLPKRKSEDKRQYKFSTS